MEMINEKLKYSNQKINPLEWYLVNKERYREVHMECECYLAIDYAFTCEVPKEVYQVIAGASIEAYLHDENKISLNSIADFLAIGLKKEKIKLEDIQNTDKWDLLKAVIEDDYSFLKSDLEL